VALVALSVPIVHTLFIPLQALEILFPEEMVLWKFLWLDLVVHPDHLIVVVWGQVEVQLYIKNLYQYFLAMCIPQLSVPELLLHNSILHQEFNRNLTIMVEVLLLQVEVVLEVIEIILSVVVGGEQ
jgi:hypothetical protein